MKKYRIKFINSKWLFGFILTFIIIAGCAFDLANVKFIPVNLSTCTKNCSKFIISSEQLLTGLPCGYNKSLKKNSEWSMIGKIEAGDVYKPKNQCFTIECSNIFEAYLVMNGTKLNGFYLPVEDGFVSLDKQIELEIK